MTKPRAPVSTIVHLATLCEYALTYAFVTSDAAMRTLMQSIATQCATFAESIMRDYAKRRRTHNTKATP